MFRTTVLAITRIALLVAPVLLTFHSTPALAQPSGIFWADVTTQRICRAGGDGTNVLSLVTGISASALAAASVPAVTNDFNPDEVFLPGELYQLTRGWPGHEGVTVVRLNTNGGAHVPLLDYDLDIPVYATYDPYRNALVALHGTQQAFVLVDAAGGFMLEPFTWPYVVATFAATGDGRIYLVDQNVGYMGFIDASGLKCPQGQVCDLLDVDDSPFVLGAGQPRNMI